MRVDEVAEELGVSKPYAYKLIKRMNEELAQTGCITIAGRIDRKFFHEKFYGTRAETKRKPANKKSSPPRGLDRRKFAGRG